MSIKQILGDGKEEENLLRFVQESGVGLRPPGEVVNGDGPGREGWLDRLNEFMEFFEGM